MSRIVIHRKRGERVYLDLPSGDRVIVTIAAPGPVRAKVVIEAPRDVIVNREEIAHLREKERNG